MTKKVLIVDDDVNNRDFLSTVLKKNGYESALAKDGVEGFEMLKAAPPDVVVLDVMMPRKTGFVFFKQMKRDDALKDIPVIMLTAIAGIMEEDKTKDTNWTIGEIKDAFQEKMENMVESFRSEGEMKPEMFLDKPIQPDKFIEAIKQVIG